MGRIVIVIPGSPNDSTGNGTPEYGSQSISHARNRRVILSAEINALCFPIRGKRSCSDKTDEATIFTTVDDD
jgi:hypothetical protein